MQKRPLGRTGLDVSVLCLGTMTWGQQNTEAEAHQQIDYALDNGINFIDTAEMYPVPPQAPTQGDTERLIGTWNAANRHRRDQFILATKIAGRSEMTYIRNGDTPRVTPAQIEYAVDQSLKRLQTDYIDLYQIHWPDRATNYFAQVGYEHKPEDDPVPVAEQLEGFKRLIDKGKIRALGVSNETPWGLMEFFRQSEALDLPRIQSIQNCYHLLNRRFEIGLAEIAIKEACGLLAYSPLAMGMLSGKYQSKVYPEGSRFKLFDRFQRYTTPAGFEATGKYVELAEKHGLDPAQMALAFVTSRDFVTSNIIGATTMEQLASNIASADITLSDEVLAGIHGIHMQRPDPCA